MDMISCYFLQWRQLTLNTSQLHFDWRCTSEKGKPRSVAKPNVYLSLSNCLHYISLGIFSLIFSIEIWKVSINYFCNFEWIDKGFSLCELRSSRTSLQASSLERFFDYLLCSLQAAASQPLEKLAIDNIQFPRFWWLFFSTCIPHPSLYILVGQVLQ